MVKDCFDAAGARTAVGGRRGHHRHYNYAGVDLESTSTDTGFTAKIHPRGPLFGERSEIRPKQCPETDQLFHVEQYSDGSIDSSYGLGLLDADAIS